MRVVRDDISGQTKMLGSLPCALATDEEINQRQSKVVKVTAKEKCKCQRCKKIIGKGRTYARISTDFGVGNMRRAYHVKCANDLCKLRSTRKFVLPPGGCGYRVIRSVHGLD